MPVYFGSTIRQARQALHLTQKQLAERLGVKNTTVSNWEKDLSKPQPDMIERLCAELGLAPGTLFGQAEPAEMGFDDFTYALHNEAQGLTRENQEKLLEMARFFRQQQEKEGR